MTDAIDATAVMTAMSNYAYNFDQYMSYANNANLTEEERNELWDQGLVFADQNQIEDYLQNRNKTIIGGISINTSNNNMNYSFAPADVIMQYRTDLGRYYYIISIPNGCFFIGYLRILCLGFIIILIV